MRSTDDVWQRETGMSPVNGFVTCTVSGPFEFHSPQVLLNVNLPLPIDRNKVTHNELSYSSHIPKRNKYQQDDLFLLYYWWTFKCLISWWRNLTPEPGLVNINRILTWFCVFEWHQARDTTEQIIDKCIVQSCWQQVGSLTSRKLNVSYAFPNLDFYLMKSRQTTCCVGCQEKRSPMYFPLLILTIDSPPVNCAKLHWRPVWF